MKQYKDLNKSFEKLGLEYGASLDDIKKTYHKLAKLYHPDKIKSSKDKKNAEERFIEIKEAYDILVEYYGNDKINQGETYNEFNNDFSEFFSSNNDEDELYTQNNNKSSKRTRENIVSDFETYIKKNKISKYDVFMSIYNNKPIYKDKLGYQVSEMMFKDNIYRSHVKTTPEYLKFTKNISLLKKLDVDVILYYDSVIYENKEINFDLNYEYKNICSLCQGWGCRKCNDGIVIKKKKLKVKIPKVNDGKTFMIKDKGNVSPWKNGDIKIKLKPIKNLKNNKHTDFYYKQLSKSRNTMDMIKTATENVSDSLIATFNFLKDHKIHTIYILAIVVLIIIIILLACLL